MENSSVTSEARACLFHRPIQVQIDYSLQNGPSIKESSVSMIPMRIS